MEDRCISCGAIIPEGRQVCPSCEKGEVKCKDCEHLELELPYAVCSKAYMGIVNPDDSCGKGKRKGDQPRKDVGK